MHVSREIVTRFSLDIAMSFGMDKCAVIHSAEGDMIISLFIHQMPKLSG